MSRGPNYSTSWNGHEVQSANPSRKCDMVPKTALIRRMAILLALSMPLGCGNDEMEDSAAFSSAATVPPGIDVPPPPPPGGLVASVPNFGRTARQHDPGDERRGGETRSCE